MQRARLGEALHGLLGRLVAIPSTFPPGDTSAIVAFCAELLARDGFAANTLSRAPGVANLVATRGAGAPAIVFNAHVDTTGPGPREAWRSDPLAATLLDGRIYGLGAANCKASVAVQLWLAAEIARRGGPQRGTLAFTFVGDEENLGPHGMAYLREVRAIRPDTLIVAAPTRNRLVLEERGVMWLRVTARGRAAHAGAPHTGDSAILKMHRVIGALQDTLAPRIAARRSASGQQSTLSIGRIRGGENTNVVPELCTIEIDRRILPEEDFDGAVEEVRQAALAAGAHAVELLTGTPGFRAPADGAGVRAFGEAIRAHTGRPPEALNVVGASDGRYFARDGIEIIVFGPGDGADSHVPNEFVALDELVDAALIQLGVAERLLGLA